MPYRDLLVSLRGDQVLYNYEDQLLPGVYLTLQTGNRVLQKSQVYVSLSSLKFLSPIIRAETSTTVESVIPVPTIGGFRMGMVLHAQGNPESRFRWALLSSPLWINTCEWTYRGYKGMSSPPVNTIQKRYTWLSC